MLPGAGRDAACPPPAKPPPPPAHPEPHLRNRTSSLATGPSSPVLAARGLSNNCYPIWSSPAVRPSGQSFEPIQGL